MFGPEFQRQARLAAERVVRPLARLGLSPNIVSLLGLVLNGVAAAILAWGPLRWGGVMVLFAGIFDMADGAVARVQQTSSLFGAFLDSVLDRYAEGFVMLGLIVYALRQLHGGPQSWVITLAYLAALFSLLVSYTRARAEGLGLDCKVGLMERPERVIVLGLGVVIGGAAWLPWVLGVMVVATGFTGLQRIAYVWRQAHARSGAAPLASTIISPPPPFEGHPNADR